MRLSFMLVLLLPACADDTECKAFAEHVADVVANEKGEAVDAEMRAKMVKQTAESCAAEPPSKAALDCAIAAKSSEAMKKCDATE